MSNLSEALGDMIGEGEYDEELVKAMSKLLILLLTKVSTSEEEDLAKALKSRIMQRKASSLANHMIPSPS